MDGEPYRGVAYPRQQYKDSGTGADRFTVRRDTGGDYRIFTVTSGRVVSISGITISGGNVPGDFPGDFGGGIANRGTLTVSDSTISGNSSGGFGGGIVNSTSLTSTTITNSTISGNSAASLGGGVLNFNGPTVIKFSTIIKNSAPAGEGSGVASFCDNATSTEVLSSIISANINTDVDFVHFTDCSGAPFSINSFVSNGYNLIGDGNATGDDDPTTDDNPFSETGDQIDVTNPGLGALADNGGPTMTHALLAGSPAIDKGNTDFTTDQRSEPRPFDDPGIAPATGGDDSDIGSFAAQSVLNSAPDADDDAYSTNEDTALNVGAAQGVLANDTDPDSGDTLSAVKMTDPSHGQLTLNNDGSFTYTPDANYNNTAANPDTFTYKANDGTADSIVATVNITVNAVNDVPSFTKGADQSVNEDAGAQSVSGWATNISAGPSDESGQQVSFEATNDNPSLFTAAGQRAISSDGTLTYTPAQNANGSATVSVKATDDGGTTDGGQDTSATQTFTITVTAVTDAPTVAVAPGGSCGSSSDMRGTVNLALSDPDDPPQSLTLSASSSNRSILPNSNISFGGAPTPLAP